MDDHKEESKLDQEVSGLNNRAANFAEFLAQARFMISYQTARSEAFTSRASNLLAVCGVMLTLLTGLLVGKSLNPGATWTVSAGIVLLVICGSLCVVVTFPRHSMAPSVQGFRDAYIELRVNPNDELYLTREQLTSMLVGASGQPPVLESLANDATTRGKYFAAASITFVASLIPLVIAYLFLMIGE